MSRSQRSPLIYLKAANAPVRKRIAPSAKPNGD
jgi:hypothetical protein